MDPRQDEARCDEAGRFAMHAALGPGQWLELGVTAEDHVAVERLPVSPGRTDLRIVLGRTASVEGSVLLGPGILPLDLEIQLDRDDDRGGPGEVILDSSGNFRLTGIDPGVVRIGFAVNDQTCVWESPPFPVLGGEHLRPDCLREIDLRGLVQLLVLEVVDEAGRPVHPTLEYRAAGEENGAGHRFVQGQFTRLSTTTAGLDVTLGGREYRELRLFGLVGRQRVTLLPAPMAILELPPDLPGDGDGVRLEIWHRGPDGLDYVRDLRFAERTLETPFPYPGTFELEWSYCPCGLDGFVAHHYQKLHEDPIELVVEDLREPQLFAPPYPVAAHRAVYESR